MTRPKALIVTVEQLEQLLVPGVPPAPAPAPARRGTPIAADLLDKPCPVCKRDVSKRSHYRLCTLCRTLTRHVRSALLQCTRHPAFLEAVCEQVGTIAANEAPQVLSVLQGISNRLRNEARGDAP